MQTGHKKLILILIILNVTILLITGLNRRQRQKEAHAREVQKEQVEQLKEDFQLFEQENEVILRTILHDLQTLDEEFKRVQQTKMKNHDIHLIERLINKIFASESSSKSKNGIEMATDLPQFKRYLAMYNRGTAQIQQDIQMRFTKSLPTTFSQVELTKGERLQDSLPFRDNTDTFIYSGRVNGLTVGFKNLFPRFYRLLEERDFKLQIIRGATTNHTSYIREQGLDNNRLQQVHFEQEYFMKAPTQTTNMITNLRIAFTYDLDKQRLDIKFDYRGLPI